MITDQCQNMTKESANLGFGGEEEMENEREISLKDSLAQGKEKIKQQFT